MDRLLTGLLRSAWLFVLPVALSAVGGCSLFFDLNTTQCDVTPDCLALGPQFANTTCVNRVCVAAPSGASGAGAASGSGGAGGSSGTDASGAGGVVAQGGSAGSAGQPECVSNTDCITAHVDQPYVCQGGACLQLTTLDCPLLLPTDTALDLLKKGEPIVLGGYANMTNPQDPHDSQAIINWDLAFDELNTATLGGLPSQDGSSQLRPVVGLICQGTADDITPSLTHLTQEVGVPGILTTLTADKLLAAFDFTRSSDYVNAGSKPVFFMSTGSADLRLANLMDDGLVWHMLGDPRTLAATITALLKRIEPYVQAQRALNCPATPCADDPSTPLRVTLVYSDQPTMVDLFTVLTTPDASHPEILLSFNGQAAIDQLPGIGSGAFNGAFREVKIQSAQTTTTPDVSSAITDLEQFPPHVVLAIATSEFPQTVIPALERNWGTSGSASVGMQRPYYLASQLIYNTAALQATAAAFATPAPALNTRLVGVNYAEAQDTHSKQLYASYEGRLQNSYTGTLPLAGTENYYDGAYSLLYALAAAARDNPDGSDLVDGLENRVFSTSSSAESVDVGPAALAATVGMLSTPTYKMSLWGTMGAPNFDRASGTRISTTSAWCIQAGTSSWDYQADGLIYDPDSQTFTDPAAPKPACLAQY